MKYYIIFINLKYVQFFYFHYYISIDVSVIFQIFHPSPEESLADTVKGIQKRDSGI